MSFGLGKRAWADTLRRGKLLMPSELDANAAGLARLARLDDELELRPRALWVLGGRITMTEYESS